MKPTTFAHGVPDEALADVRRRRGELPDQIELDLAAAERRIFNRTGDVVYFDADFADDFADSQPRRVDFAEAVRRRRRARFMADRRRRG